MCAQYYREKKNTEFTRLNVDDKSVDEHKPKVKINKNQMLDDCKKVEYDELKKNHGVFFHSRSFMVWVKWPFGSTESLRFIHGMKKERTG